MTIFVLFLLACIVISIYFMIHYIESSIFIKPGFTSNEISLDEINLNQCYHFDFKTLKD